jgi:hypothetical protein
MLKKALVLVFMVWLLVPAAAWLLVAAAPDPEDLRGAVEVPSPCGGALLKTDYYRALDRHINEAFVFRTHAQRFKRWVDYRFFGRTDSPEVHVGRQGWLYRRADVENHIRSRCSDAGDALRRLFELHAVEKVVSASGRRLRFLVVPSKASIYPEYLGGAPLPPGGRCSAYDLLREAHSKFPLDAWVPLESAIQSNKFGTHLLYDPTGSFWNGRGAAVAAEALHRSLFDTDLLAPVRGVADQRHDLRRQLLDHTAESPKTAVRQLEGLNADGLGRTLVYGDGAVDHLLPHLAQMGSHLKVITTEMLPSRRLSEDWRAFDNIFIQASEANLPDLHIDLDRIYDQLLDEARGTRRTAVDLRSLRPVAHSSLNPVDDGVAVKSVGARSSFALIDLPGSYRRCFRVLRLSLSALRPDRMTVAFRSRPEILVSKVIQPERFNVYLPLPVKSRVNLRLQPGDQAGLLVVHAAEIIGFPSGGEGGCGHAPRPARSETLTDGRPASTSGAPYPAASSGEPQDPGAAARITQHGTRAPAPVASPQATAGTRSQPPLEVPKKDLRDDRGAGSADKPAQDPAAASQVATASPEASAIAGENRQAQAEGESSPIAVVAEPLPTTIALNDFADGRIFQRRDGKADIIVSGAYSGAVQEIEARVVRHGGSEVVVPWTIIDPAPRNGIFLGLLPGVPEGGWYALEVRLRGGRTIAARGRHRWAVGMLIACIGQSNMKEWFHTGRDLEAHPLVRMHTRQGWQTLDRRGNGAIAFANRIIARTGVPVGLLEYAVNGSGLHPKADWGTGFWGDTRSGSIYRRFVSAVEATGGRVEFVLWIQGEADAARGTVTGEEYQSALVRFINRQVRMDIGNGSARPELPFLVVAMVKRPGGQDEPHQALREAQWAAADQVTECYLAATTVDLRNQGKQHLAPEAYTRMGRRVAQTVLHILGLESFYRGPRVIQVIADGARSLMVTLQHGGGRDIRPASGITGWDVVDREGPIDILNVVRQDSQTLRIQLARPIEAPAEARYLFGARPDTRRPVVDDASPPLPLEAYRGGIDARPISPDASPADERSP